MNKFWSYDSLDDVSINYDALFQVEYNFHWYQLNVLFPQETRYVRWRQYELYCLTVNQIISVFLLVE